MSTLVVKLGGAAITDKSVPDKLSESIDALVERIAQVYHQILAPSGRHLILIHGAGSFGHPPAKKYQVKAGWIPASEDWVGDAGSKAVKFGMALTRQRVLQLHLHVLQRLQDDGKLPVLSVSTYDTVDTDKGEVTPASSSRLVARVQHVLDQGFVPLLFGDAVLDHALGCTILSGDALMYHLAQRLPDVRRCVFLTDVAGIFTKDPKTCDDAVLIRRIQCSELGDGGAGALDQEESGGATNAVDDVTGAMRSKWQWAKRIVTGAEQVQEVVICNTMDSFGALSKETKDPDDEFETSSTWTTIVL